MTPLFPCILKRLIPTALVVDVPYASVQPRHRWARPGHLHRMVADCDCIVRNLVRVADGRVKPRHDVGAAMAWGARVGFSGGWYNSIFFLRYIPPAPSRISHTRHS